MKLRRALFAPMLAAAAAVQAQTAPMPPPPATSPPVPARAEDVAAIRANDEAFIRAFNAGDARALAGTFTDDAEMTDEEGVTVEGRAAISARFAELFQASPGVRISLRSDPPRFLAADTAMVRGRAEVSPADGGGPETSRYTVVFVRRGGQWLQASVRDEEDRAASHAERLEALAWLVGDWVSESAEAVVHTTFRWDDNKSFLVRAFTVRVHGRPAMTGQQRIGWDPLTGQFRSWSFDSEGGYSEGYWSRQADRWLIKASGVRGDGRHASATHVLTRLNKDMIRWTSVDRTVAGRTAPNVDEFVLVRKPPPPR